MPADLCVALAHGSTLFVAAGFQHGVFAVLVLDAQHGLLDFFTDTKKLEKEKKLQQAMLGIKNKYGKNAVLKASSYEEGATMRRRNAQIGGHSAGGSAGGSDGKLQK